MKKILLFLFGLVIVQAFSQDNVGVGTTTPDASAIMHIDANDKGLLIPRMDSLGMTLITSPANGLMIYNLTDNAFWYYEVNQWSKIGGGVGNNINANTVTSIIDTVAWKLKGNAGTNPSTNFIGTTDAQDFVIRTDNTERARILATGELGISTTTPTQPLDVNGKMRYRPGADVDYILVSDDVDGNASWKHPDSIATLGGGGISNYEEIWVCSCPFFGQNRYGENTNNSTWTLLPGKKFSDYDEILFMTHTGNYRIIPVPLFTDITGITLARGVSNIWKTEVFSGDDSGHVGIAYISDTSFRLGTYRLQADPEVGNLKRIYGIKR